MSFLMRIVCFFLKHKYTTMYIGGSSCEKVTYCERCQHMLPKRTTEHPQDRIIWKPVAEGKNVQDGKCDRCGQSVTRRAPAQ